MAGFCVHGNELVVSIKCGGFLDFLRNYKEYKNAQCSYAAYFIWSDDLYG